MPWVLLAAALVGTLVVVVGLGIAAWQLLVPSLLGGGGAAESSLEVPSLEGKTLAAAHKEVGEDFTLVVSSSKKSSAQPKGTILSQEPKPGTQAQRGDEISVALSSGTAAPPGTADVPEVVGKSKEEAQKILSSEGFEVKVEPKEGSQDKVGEVIGQSPSGGAEAKKGTEVRIAVGEAGGVTPGYNLIQDPTGSLSVEAPPEWGVLSGADSEGAGSNWSNFVGYGITSSITTAPDLYAWHTQPYAPGAYIVASRELAQGYTDDELLFSGPNQALVQSASCPDTPQDWQRPPYSGRIITCNNYDGTGATLHLVVAAPESRDCVVLLQVKTLDEADAEAGRHILDTFKADCGGIARAKAGDGAAEFADVSEGGTSG